jgi:hypothetical protein
MNAFITKDVDMFFMVESFLQQKGLLKGIISKSDSWLFKILGWLLFFNKGFNKYFITTIGSTVYWRQEDKNRVKDIYDAMTLSHEGVHLNDYKEWGGVFQISYLLPQLATIFCFLAFLSFINVYCLFFLLFIIMLLPMPSIFRLHWELKGYVISHILRCSVFIDNPKMYYQRYIEEQFVSSNYYFMFPFKKKLRKQFNTYLLNLDPFQKELIALWEDKLGIAIKDKIKDLMV